MSIALARRYRPRRFADLLVQDHVAAALRGAVAKNRVGHGYLLTGPRGVGKTTAARILAMALNCERRDLEHPTGEPCGECASCERIWNGQANLDVVEIDAASNRGVDDARDLRERAMYAASQDGHHKVYIVDEAHMLTREAWNALLKILEEPPPGVVFVFATTEPQKIFNTAAPVMSRLQRFDFRRIGPAAIQSRLREVLRTEGLDAEDDALLLIGAPRRRRDARRALGARPVPLLRRGAAHGRARARRPRPRQRRVVRRRAHARGRPESRRGLRRARPLMDSGADLAEFAGGLSEVLRALVMHHYGVTPEDLPESTLALIAAVGDRDSPPRMRCGCSSCWPTPSRRSAGAPTRGSCSRRCCSAGRCSTASVDLKALLRGQAPAGLAGRGLRRRPPAADTSGVDPAAAAPAAAHRNRRLRRPLRGPRPSGRVRSHQRRHRPFSVPPPPTALRAIWGGGGGYGSPEHAS